MNKISNKTNKTKKISIVVLSIIISLVLIIMLFIPNPMNGNISLIRRLINAFDTLDGVVDYEVYRYDSSTGIYSVGVIFYKAEGIKQVEDLNTGNIIYAQNKSKLTIDVKAEDPSDFRYVLTSSDGTTENITYHFERERYGKDDYVKVNNVYANKPNITGFNTEYTKYVTLADDGTMQDGSFITDPEPAGWYDYNAVDTEGTKSPKWANICIDYEGVKNYAVWIPRYCYKYDSTNSVSGNERMDIKFIDVFNNYTDGDTGEILTWEELQAFGYKLPETFEFGTYKEKTISGFWISKYELSAVDASLKVGDVTAVYQSNGGSALTQNRNTWITGIRQMEGLGKGFGLDETLKSDLLPSTFNDIDIHMQKNTEYGTMLLLSASQYGKPTKIENGETTTGNATGVVMPYNNEWVAAQHTDWFGTTGYNVRYIDYYEYSSNYSNQKAGDAYLETRGWHGSNWRYQAPTDTWGNNGSAYNRPGGITRINGSVFGFDNQALYSTSNHFNNHGHGWMTYVYTNNGPTTFSNGYTSRFVIMNGKKL